MYIYLIYDSYFQIQPYTQAGYMILDNDTQYIFNLYLN